MWLLSRTIPLPWPHLAGNVGLWSVRGCQLGELISKYWQEALAKCLSRLGASPQNRITTCHLFLFSEKYFLFFVLFLWHLAIFFFYMTRYRTLDSFTRHWWRCFKASTLLCFLFWLWVRTFHLFGYIFLQFNIWI